MQSVAVSRSVFIGFLHWCTIWFKLWICMHLSSRRAYRTFCILEINSHSPFFFLSLHFIWQKLQNAACSMFFILSVVALLLDDLCAIKTTFQISCLFKKEMVCFFSYGRFLCASLCVHGLALIVSYNILLWPGSCPVSPPCSCQNSSDL